MSVWNSCLSFIFQNQSHRPPQSTLSLKPHFQSSPHPIFTSLNFTFPILGPASPSWHLPLGSGRATSSTSRKTQACRTNLETGNNLASSPAAWEGAADSQELGERSSPKSWLPTTRCHLHGWPGRPLPAQERTVPSGQAKAGRQHSTSDMHRITLFEWPALPRASTAMGKQMSFSKSAIRKHLTSMTTVKTACPNTRCLGLSHCGLRPSPILFSHHP